ncbi:MAG: 6-bladed beta-propeller [Tannerellaceae bacterium]|nr:6-bladed beta-propeller [Tannerellaceae bacterium]
MKFPGTVNLVDAINNVDSSIKMSDFVESITYIPLKLPNDYFLKFCWLSAYDEKEKIFIVGDIFNVLIVDSAGQFKSPVGRRGQGPGEYPQRSSVTIDTEGKAIYLQAAHTGRIQKYDYNGRFIKTVFSISRDSLFTSNVFYRDSKFVMVGEVFYSSLINRLDIIYGFGLKDSTGKWLDARPPQVAQVVDKVKNGRYVQFMPFGDLSFYKEFPLLLYMGLSDTIFTAQDNKIVPRYFLNYGNEKPDLTELWAMGDERRRAIYKSIFITNKAFETDRYLFVKVKKKKVEYIIIHDKYTGEDKAVTYDYWGIPGDMKNEMLDNINAYFGFRNDIDGGVDAYPHITSDDGRYWVSYIDAHLMKSVLTDEYFASRTDVKDIAGQNQLKELVGKLDENDNPVLILMKLKDGV